MDAFFLCRRRSLIQETWSLCLCWVAAFMWSLVTFSWSLAEYVDQHFAMCPTMVLFFHALWGLTQTQIVHNMVSQQLLLSRVIFCSSLLMLRNMVPDLAVLQHCFIMCKIIYVVFQKQCFLSSVPCNEGTGNRIHFRLVRKFLFSVTYVCALKTGYLLFSVIVNVIWCIYSS
jgi:hypothetical protein